MGTILGTIFAYLMKPLVWGSIFYIVFLTALPSGDPLGAIDIALSFLFIEIPEYIFYSLEELTGIIKQYDGDDVTGIRSIFINLLWIASILANLAIPILWIFFVICYIFISITFTVPWLATIITLGAWTKNGPVQTSGSSTWTHLAFGRVSVQDTIDAEVNANAIAEALKNK